MKTNIVAVGSSKGVRIPSLILKEFGLHQGDQVDLQAKQGKIILIPVKKSEPRQGWENRIREENAKYGEDNELMMTSDDSVMEDYEW